MSSKGVRFEQLPTQLKPSPSDTELVQVLSEVKSLHKKNIDASKTISEQIEARAEEMVRYIKKVKNELLDECYATTKQNNMSLSLVEGQVHSKFDKKPEKEISKMLEDLISCKSDSAAHDRDGGSFSKTTRPHIDVLTFKSGLVDMQALKRMFGGLIIEGTDRFIQTDSIDDSEDDSELSKVNIKHKNGPLNEQYGLNETKQVTKVRPFVKRTIQWRAGEVKESTHGNDRGIKNGLIKLPINTNEKTNVKLEGKDQGSKNNKSSGYFQLWSEESRERNYLASQITLENESVNLGLTIQPILHLAIDCDDKPICCLSVVDPDTCWIHQGFSTLNYLLNISSNKRKKVQFDFEVEDWALKPPNTILALDFNYRIAKLTPIGPVDTPLTATQNIGWTFHKIDMHPIGIAYCDNGNILVALVDEMSYNVHSKSRRKVIRMNDHFDEISTIEYYGGRPLFTLPRRLAENTNGDICIVDEISENKGQVFIFNGDESLRIVYSGIDSRDTVFNPNGICCDSSSRVIISDYNGNKLHILDETGKLLQYIVHPEINRSFCVAVDCCDRIWIGLKCGRIIVLELPEPKKEADTQISLPN